MSSAAIFHATAMPDPEWWHASWAQPDDVVAAIGITAGMRVIELCCGDGWTLPLARIACHVFALDLEVDLLAEHGDVPRRLDADSDLFPHDRQH